MDLSKRLTIAALATVIALGLCPPSNAQVSCSPKVPVRTCKEAARLLNLPLQLIGEHKGVQLELVSPAEYKARVSQIKKDLRLGPYETVGCAPDSQKAFFQNCADINVLFIRGGSSDLTPRRLLVSSNEAADIFMLLRFLEGYYQGLNAEMAASQNK